VQCSSLNAEEVREQAVASEEEKEIINKNERGVDQSSSAEGNIEDEQHMGDGNMDGNELEDVSDEQLTQTMENFRVQIL